MKTKMKFLCLVNLVFSLLLTVCVLAKDSEAIGLSDGEYAIDVELVGGSGRATIESPTILYVKDGMASAKITWSSPYYDYMIVDGDRYDNMSEEGMNSLFVIPISVFDAPMDIVADTTAMSVPHEIEYTLTFYSDSIASDDALPQEQAKKVILIALGIIVVGGIVNVIVKKKRGGE